MSDSSFHILRRHQVEAKVALSRSGIYKLVSEGRFPKPVRLAPGAIGWRSDEIDAWLESRPRAKE